VPFQQLSGEVHAADNDRTVNRAEIDHVLDRFPWLIRIDLLMPQFCAKVKRKLRREGKIAEDEPPAPFQGPNGRAGECPC
jgi:hypothetical protein